MSSLLVLLGFYAVFYGLFHGAEPPKSEPQKEDSDSILEPSVLTPGTIDL